jgi:hypothetical protein
MDISDFLTQTLLGIKKGIEGANSSSEHNYFNMMADDVIKFDIAVTASDKIAGEGNSKVGFPIVASLGANVSAESENSRISRIKFEIRSAYNSFGQVSK